MLFWHWLWQFDLPSCMRYISRKQYDQGCSSAVKILCHNFSFGTLIVVNSLLTSVCIQSCLWIIVFFQPREASPVFFIVCLLRGLFIPLFLLCNVQPRPQNSYVAFNHDAFPFFLNCLFGLSNGYFATLSMIHAPRLVPEEDFEMAGSMMACFLSLGLTVGAMVSVLLVNAI